MRKTVLIILGILVTMSGYAQDHFVLIQADSARPFYIKMGDKLVNSSPHGYMILSSLKEGNHPIMLGFADHHLPEQQYVIQIDKKDLDLQLKYAADQGWGLYNVQTKEWKGPGAGMADTIQVMEVKKDDAFSRLMAGVVNDTAVMYSKVAQSSAKAAKDSAAAPKVAPPTVAPGDTAQARIVAADTMIGKSVAIAPAPGADSMRMATRINTFIPAESVPGADSTRIKVGEDTTRTVTYTMPSTAKADSARTAAGGPPLPVAAPHSDTVVVAAANKTADKTVGRSDTALAVSRVPASDSAMKELGQANSRETGTVVKLSEKKFIRSTRLVYADQGQGGKADTIVVVIPNDTAVKAAPSHNNSTVTGGKGAVVTPSPDSTKVATVVSAPAKTPAHPAATYTGAGEPLYRPIKPDTGQKKVVGTTAAKTLVVNSDCKNFASDYDVDKLRVKMLEAGKDEDRIEAAKKVFKTKCFTTKQIRALCEVFTSDAQRYHFFEVAYPFVSDDHFHELSDLLADPVYNSKFKIMTGQ